jgi:hypothetical protein
LQVLAFVSFHFARICFRFARLCFRFAGLGSHFAYNSPSPPFVRYFINVSPLAAPTHELRRLLDLRNVP